MIYSEVMLIAATTSSQSSLPQILLVAVLVAIVVVAVRRSRQRGAEPTPKAVVQTAPSETFEIASIGARIGAMMVDLILTAVVLFFAVGILQGVAGLHREQLLIAFILAILAMVAWYGWRVGAGRTVGQDLCGIRIVDKSTQAPIGTARAVGRIVVRPLSLLFSGLGFLWAIWDADRQTWHDKIVDSIVVNTRVAAIPQKSFAPPTPSQSFAAPGSEATTRLRQLDDLLANGLITFDEHATKRAQVLESL